MRAFQASVQEIPGFTGLRPIGSGGMAEVYRGTRDADGKTVALKVLKDIACTGPFCDYAERFEREARTAISLRHDNLVEAYDMGRLDDDRPYLVMEFINGLSADQNVHLDGPMYLEQAVAIFAQVADALAYMHEKGYVHRDIKPSNILLTADSMAKVSDFGLAKTADDPSVTMAGGILGTPHYLAPEQISRQAPIDRRSDIYSLGCSLYFLLIGEPPFKGTSIPLVLTRQLTDAISYPADWTDESHRRVMKLIDRMTAKQPARRYQDMHEVMYDLAWVVGETESPLDSGIFHERGADEAPPAEVVSPNSSVGSSGPEGGQLLQLPPGRVVFYEDDIADAVYWLVSGQVEVIRGGRRLAVITQPRKVLGEMALVRGALRSATVRTLTESEILRIGTDELTLFLSANKKLMHAILTDMAERIELTSTRLLRAESTLDALRQTLADLADRLASGELEPSDLLPILKSLAVDDETLS
ncbi:MAG: protein kinase [Candidatus Lernaella stagnicola]|nr:protein kinase [Candidatus Lernaella stagnicola]